MEKFRWLAAACIVACAPVLSPVGPARADAVAPGLDVPADPSGDVVVRAVADPATWPYVQVALTRPSWVAAPYDEMPAIDPAPVANPGGAVEVTVPTWGVDGDDAAFVLLGCSSSDPGSCSTLLAEEVRPVTQTVLPTASVDVPAQPVFVPEEQVAVTVHNAGGGEMRATLRGTQLGSQALPDDGTVAYGGFPAEARTRTLEVRRCSALVPTTAFCEAPVATEQVAYVREIPVETVFQEPRVLTLDPAWHGSRVDVLLYTTPLAHASSWSMYDEQGQQALGPVEVATGPSGLDQLSFGPAEVAQQRGVELAEGTYTVRFSVTVTRGELARTGTEDRTVELVADPPADEPDVLVAHRRWRDGRHLRTSPYLEVASYPGSWADGVVRLRNHHGRVVERARVSNPCWESCRDPWRLDLDELFGRAPRSGWYDVELKAPDSWGRLAVMPLGRIEVQERVAFERTVVATAREALARRRGDARVYELRIPEIRALEELGSVYAAVDPASRGAEGGLSARIPRLDERWPGGWDLSDMRTRWRRAPMVPFSDPLPWRVDLRGKPVQVRVQGDPGRSRIDRVRIQVRGYAWRPPRT